MEKIAEKIIATRLFFLTELIDLLDFDQIDDKRQKSVINVILSLVYDIQLAKHEEKVTSIFFMNIKRAFNYISAN